MSSGVTGTISRQSTVNSQQENPKKRAGAGPLSCRLSTVDLFHPDLHFGFDVSLGRPGDREPVAFLVGELVLAVEVMGRVRQGEAVVGVGEPVLKVLDDGGG